MRLKRSAVLFLLATIGPAAAARAQTPSVRIGGRVQVQYRSSAGDSSLSYEPSRVGNGFEVRRLRLQADVRMGEYISFLIMPSFENGALRMRDAYLRLKLAPALTLSVGQEKSPFQRYELISANNLSSLERGLRNLRLSGREGLNDLLMANGYISQDVGAFAEVSLVRERVQLRAGVQNGSRESSADVNNAKSAFGRATLVATRAADGAPRLQVGASLASRDRAVCAVCIGTIAFAADSAKRTIAWGVDFEWGGFRPGLHVIGDFAGGDNVRLANRVNVGRNTGNVRTTADTAIAKFRGASIIASWRFGNGRESSRVRWIEPTLRVDWLDPDADTADDEGLLLTPALALFFANTVVMRAGLDLYRYTEAGAQRTATEIRLSWEASF